MTALFNSPQLAQSEVAFNMSFQELFQKGGIMMIPLVLLSIAAIYLVIFYLLTIRRSAVVSDSFMAEADALIRKRDYLGLLAASNRKNSSIAKITEKAVDYLTNNQSIEISQIREMAEAEGSRQAGILNRRISYLADVGSIAPMVGLLGTVTGMIKSFYEISSGSSQGVRQMELAGGVYEALITTAVGLSIGIVSMIFYSFFRGRVQSHIVELEAAATHVMAMLSNQLRKAAQRHPQLYPNEDAEPLSVLDGRDALRPQPVGPTPIQEARPDLGGI